MNAGPITCIPFPVMTPHLDYICSHIRSFDECFFTSASLRQGYTPRQAYIQHKRTVPVLPATKLMDGSPSNQINGRSSTD